ncbi:MAG: glycosyltransferase, partial [Desulfobacterales bacterium]|nr:glycosyltransferase [Desulfobacterales bacterium]
ADVVVILRKTFSLPFFCLLHLCSKHLIFDLDDAIFCRSNGKPSRTRQKRFAHVARRCQQIWAGNVYLADTARRYNAVVSIVPTSLATGKYALKTQKASDHLDIVWIGSSSTRKYLEAALPFLERLVDSFPHLRLKIVADFDVTTSQLPTIAIPWSEDTESEALVSAHIGIAPMPDNPWTRGKCGLKVLQYMAAGLPVVSSPAGVNGEIVEHGVTGFLAESPEEWQVAIEKLVRDPNLRESMGQAGRKRVIERYSVDVTYRKMAQALDRWLMM